MVRFDHIRVILIGGTSHAGKSTLAQSLAARLGWSVRSTDKLARHPGRPWTTPPKTVKEHVAKHYLTLSGEALIADVLRHYRDNVWPLARDIIAAHATAASSGRLIMEGSALWPEQVATLPFDNVATLWLAARPALFAQRIHQESAYETRNALERRMIDQFLDRTWRYHEKMIETVKRLGRAWIDVEAAASQDELIEICLAALRKQDIGNTIRPPADDGAQVQAGQ